MSVFSYGERRALSLLTVVLLIVTAGRMWSASIVPAAHAVATTDPFIGDPVPAPRTNTVVVDTERGIVADEIASHLIDINTADLNTLTRLPGIGPVIASRIIEYRQAHGPFTTVSELLHVKGIGPARFEAIEPLVFVASADVPIQDDPEAYAGDAHAPEGL